MFHGLSDVWLSSSLFKEVVRLGTTIILMPEVTYGNHKNLMVRTSVF
ncbi:MAG: hypothetical protein IPJ13_24670 [Saprospiraceae bacterium]|nr:hypothetical protein [Saprospiraceae bacterium]